MVDDRLRKILVTKRQVDLSVFDRRLCRPLTLFSRLSELEAKVALYEGGTSANQSSQIDAGASELRESSTSAAQLGNIESPSRQNPAADYIDQDVTDVDFDTDDPGLPLINDQTSQEFSLPQVPVETLANIDASPTRQSSPESELMNPLALGVSAYMPNARSVPSQCWVTNLPETCH